LKTKQTLEELLKSSKDTKILILGKESIFTKDEIKKFLKKYKIDMTKNYEEGVVASIEHHQLNPVEEDISCMVYDDKIPTYDLEEFEKMMSKGLNEDEILMIIKLSKDTDRLHRLITNPNITNSLFVKLLDTYIWDNIDEDSREDRDVIIALLRRYVKIRPNEEDLLYSYLTLRRVATQAKDNNLLLAMTKMPNFEFLIRNKPKTSLRETIAKNPNIKSDTIKRLRSFRDNNINIALSSNSIVDISTLKEFQKLDNPKIDEALAININIDTEIFENLLTKSKQIISLLLTHQHIDRYKLNLIDMEYISLIGVNDNLSREVINELLLMDNSDLLKNLSSNEILGSKDLEYIYNLNKNELYIHLALNTNLPIEIIKSLYHRDNKEINISISSNHSTPQEILRELFDMNDLEINRGLASNSNTPLDILDILKIDTRLRNDLTKNSILMAEVNQQLDY